MYELLLVVLAVLVAAVLALWRVSSARGPRWGAGTGGVSPHLSPADAEGARQRFVSGAQADARYPVQDAPSILFYNVHEYIDPRGADRRFEIRTLVADAADAGAECVALAEAAPLAAARAALAPYPYRLTTSNGGTLLALGWRDPLATALVVPTTGSRNCILYNTRARRIAVVHLEIGARPLPDDPGDLARVAKNRETRGANAAERIQQLEALVAHDPDMLIGDFNFELGGAEDAWLRARGYRAVNGATPHSTPFNRVDHCYVRAAENTSGSNGNGAQKYPAASNVLMPLAHSDHRPMVQFMPLAAP
jgi:endonuclease/exonuclease/phosphatase family metal-dependent hydrolase